MVTLPYRYSYIMLYLLNGVCDKCLMAERKLPANHELAKKVQIAIVKIVLGMTVVMVMPAVVMISMIVNNGKPLQVGKNIPEFVLPDQDNSNVSVKDFYGRWCLIYFYNETRPEGVIQARRFRDNYSGFRELDLQLIGVSYDSVSSHHNFAEKLHLSHPILSDPEGDVIEEYSANTSMKKMAKNLSYLIDEKGIVKKVYIDLDPDEQVKVVSQDLRQFKHL